MNTMNTMISILCLALSIASCSAVEESRDLTYFRPKCTLPKVYGFKVINTLASTEIMDLKDGLIIDLKHLKTYGISSQTQLNFRAVTSADSSSVRFGFDSNTHFHTDSWSWSKFSLCGGFFGHF